MSTRRITSFVWRKKPTSLFDQRFVCIVSVSLTASWPWFCRRWRRCGTCAAAECSPAGSSSPRSSTPGWSRSRKCTAICVWRRKIFNKWKNIYHFIEIWITDWKQTPSRFDVWATRLFLCLWTNTNIVVIPGLVEVVNAGWWAEGGHWHLGHEHVGGRHVEVGGGGGHRGSWRCDHGKISEMFTRVMLILEIPSEDAILY